MSLINQMLSDLQERRGGLPPTEQTALSELIAAEPRPPPKEPAARGRSVLLLLLLLMSVLLVKRETVTAWFSIPASSQEGAVVAAGAPPPSSPPATVAIQAAQETRPGKASPEHTSTTTSLPSKAASEATMAATSAVAHTGASRSTTGAEISQLAIRTEDNGVALGLHLSTPVQYTLSTDPQGAAVLRLVDVRLREGYTQAFDRNNLIHDIQVQQGDGDEVAVRFSLRTGASASRTEITAAEDGGYLLTVHCKAGEVPPAPHPDASEPAISSPWFADAANSGKGNIRPNRSEGGKQTASGGKRGLLAQETPSHVEHSDAPDVEPVVIGSELPGGFHKAARAAEQLDRKTQLYEVALSTLRAGDRTRALALAMQALDADDTAIAPRLLVATMLMEDKRWAEARAQLETGLGRAPGNRDYKLLYARLLSEMGETGKAIEVLTHDAPAPEDDPDYEALLAALMQRTGRHGDAIVSYRRLLSVQPQNGLWWTGLGISLSAAGQRQQAHEAFNHALTDRNLPDRLRQYLNDQLQQLREASS